MGLQWVIDWFRQVAPESVRHLDDDPGVVSWEDYAAVVRDRRELLMKCTVYERELTMRGETPKTLAAMVGFYKRTLLNKVKAGAA